MADEDKTTVESGDQASEEVQATGGGKKKIFMLAGVGIGAIIIGVVLTIFVIKPMMSSDPAIEEDATEQDSHASESPKKEKKDSHAKKKKSAHGEEEGSESNIYSIKDIVINPAGSAGSRFLSVSFAFELESSAMTAEFESREPIIRDALITILSSKTVAQLTDPKQKEVVRYLIKKRIARLMETEELAGVYYTDFVLQ